VHASIKPTPTRVRKPVEVEVVVARSKVGAALQPARMRWRVRTSAHDSVPGISGELSAKDLHAEHGVGVQQTHPRTLRASSVRVVDSGQPAPSARSGGVQ
jgi:hypothetical protein